VTMYIIILHYVYFCTTRILISKQLKSFVQFVHILLLDPLMCFVIIIRFNYFIYLLSSRAFSFQLSAVYKYLIMII